MGRDSAGGPPVWHFQACKYSRVGLGAPGMSRADLRPHAGVVCDNRLPRAGLQAAHAIAWSSWGPSASS